MNRTFPSINGAALQPRSAVEQLSNASESVWGTQ
jgi:hypothetical protein